MIDPTIPSLAQAAIRYWWLFLVEGLISLAVGALLIAAPGKTVEFVAIVLGVYVILWGIIQIASAFVMDDRRGLHLLVGIAALVVGGLVIGDPERTVRLVAVVIGIYLMIWGLVALLSLFGERPDKATRVVQGILALVAGILVVALPGHGITFVAVVVGIWMVIAGIAEIYGSFRLRRLAKA